VRDSGGRLCVDGGFSFYPISLLPFSPPSFSSSSPSSFIFSSSSLSHLISLDRLPISLMLYFLYIYIYTYVCVWHYLCTWVHETYFSIKIHYQYYAVCITSKATMRTTTMGTPTTTTLRTDGRAATAFSFGSLAGFAVGSDPVSPCTVWTSRSLPRGRCCMIFHWNPPVCLELAVYPSLLCTE
jgi:hypothetical protein